MNDLILQQVRHADVSWRDTRKQLRKDHRYELAEGLERDEKEKLFEEHVEALSKKNKEMFHKLLDETQEVNKIYVYFIINIVNPCFLIRILM